MTKKDDKIDFEKLDEWFQKNLNTRIRQVDNHGPYYACDVFDLGMPLLFLLGEDGLPTKVAALKTLNNSEEWLLPVYGLSHKVMTLAGTEVKSWKNIKKQIVEFLTT